MYVCVCVLGGEGLVGVDSHMYTAHDTIVCSREHPIMVCD